jgi:hypothetical protein
MDIVENIDLALKVEENKVIHKIKFLICSVF